MDLLGFERYLKRQAQLLEQSKRLKSSKALRNGDKESAESSKKKLLPPEKTEKWPKKRKTVPRKPAIEVPVGNSEDNTTAEKTNTDENNSLPRKRSALPESQNSGSEYVPSDGEILESGTVKDTKHSTVVRLPNYTFVLTFFQTQNLRAKELTE